MSWLSKLFAVTTNSVNETMTNVTESLVDIKREGNALVARIDKDVKEIHSKVLKAQEQVQLSKFEINKMQQQIQCLTETAKRAVKSGDDVDATNALSRVEGLELICKTHQETVDMLEPLIEQQILRINSMNSEKQLLKAEITKLDLEESQYKLRASLAGSNGTERGGIDLNYLRERVTKARATCEAKEIVNSQIYIENVQKEQVTSDSVKNRLDALKEELT